MLLNMIETSPYLNHCCFIDRSIHLSIDWSKNGTKIFRQHRQKYRIHEKNDILGIKISSYLLKELCVSTDISPVPTGIVL